MSKVVLVACVGQKLDHAALAADLYRSPWFHKARRYAEMVADRWWILSAKHGLVAPDEVIEPYDETLRKMPARRRRQWTCQVLENLTLTTDPAWDKVTVLAGRAYRELLVAWLAYRGYTVDVPMEGLSIGRQLQWLNRAIEDLEQERRPVQSTRRSPDSVGQP
jgi:hypothetical protein